MRNQPLKQATSESFSSSSTQSLAITRRYGHKNGLSPATGSIKGGRGRKTRLWLAAFPSGEVCCVTNAPATMCLVGGFPRRNTTWKYEWTELAWNAGSLCCYGEIKSAFSNTSSLTESLMRPTRPHAVDKNPQIHPPNESSLTVKGLYCLSQSQCTGKFPPHFLLSTALLHTHTFLSLSTFRYTYTWHLSLSLSLLHSGLLPTEHYITPGYFTVHWAPRLLNHWFPMKSG